MSVRKFSSAEDVPAPPPASGVREGLAAACAMSEVSRLFGHRHRAPRGVRKFRSVAEAGRHRANWEAGAKPSIDKR